MCSKSQAREVWVFGPDGRRIGTRGRPGQGPGEFSQLTSIGLINDTLWARDGSRQRISWFDRDGMLVHETPGSALPVATDVPGMSLSLVIGDPLADGFVGSSYNRIMGGGAADRPFYVPVVRFDRLGAIVDTVRWDTVDLGPTIRLGGRALHPPSLRPQSPVVQQLGDGRIESRWSEGGGVLEVLRLNAGGDTVAKTRIGYEPIPLPAHVRDSLLARPEGIGSMYGVSDAEFDAALAAGVQLPSHRPPLRSTHVAVDGSVWIELNGSSSEWADWIILDPELRPRGRIALPPRMTPRHVRGSTLWMVELDDLDVPWLVRLRLD